MSSENITVVWQVGRNFDISNLETLLDDFGSRELKPTAEHQKQLWKTNSLTIILYEKSLVVQGKKDDYSIKILQNINGIEGLSLDEKNRERFVKILPVSQNAILCGFCGKPIYLINSSIEGLDVIFNNECGHRNDLNPPFIMYVNRILPDFNILISKHFSRLINLGYFKGSEILIPEYMLQCKDLFIGKKNSAAISDELKNLRALEGLNKISILSYKDNIEIPSTRVEFDRTEDQSLLEIAKFTNSILLTSDNNLKDMTILQKRPIIFLSSDAIDKIKILEAVRRP